MQAPRSHELFNTGHRKTSALKNYVKEQIPNTYWLHVAKIYEKRSVPSVSFLESLIQSMQEYHGYQLQHISASKVFPVVKLTHGGPKAFGLGMGLVEPLEQLAWLHALPDPYQQAKLDRKLQRQKLIHMQRNFSTPVHHLDDMTRQKVLSGRLKILLYRFWGLMNEVDRPWQYGVIVHLCCKLPVEVSKRYRQIKPSTMQHLLAKRAKLESTLKESAQLIDKEVDNLARWEYQTLELGATVPEATLEMCERRLREAHDLAVQAMALIENLVGQAKQLKDMEYVQYVEGLNRVASGCRAQCGDLQRSNLSYIQRLNKLNSELRGEQARISNRERSLAISKLGPMPPSPRSPNMKYIVWRYPPALGPLDKTVLTEGSQVEADVLYFQNNTGSSDSYVAGMASMPSKLVNAETGGLMQGRFD